MLAAIGGGLLAAVAAFLAAVFWQGRAVAGNEGWPVAYRNCTRLAAGFLALAVVGLWVVAAHAQSGDHGDGHREMHPTYKNWLDGRGFSCCDDSDCRPTRAWRGDDGRWRAWDGRGWVVVPVDAVLPIPSPDMRSHICMTPGALEPRCFVPGPVVH
ncbi:MAG: hypothetical protein U1E23_09635 [Reyranellaceae bacterium]